MEHIFEIYFCLVQSLSLHTQLSVFLVDNVTLKTFKCHSLDRVLISAAVVH